MRRYLSFITIILALAFIATNVQAQPMSPYGGRGGFKGHRSKKMAENFENLRYLKMLEVLDLTTEQSDKFVPLYSQHRKQMREFRETQEKLVDSLRVLLENDGNGAEVRRISNALRVGEIEKEKLTDGFIDKCSEFLTDYQVGRLILFKHSFERDILEGIREFRNPGPPHRDKPGENPEGKI